MKQAHPAQAGIREEGRGKNKRYSVMTTAKNVRIVVTKKPVFMLAHDTK